MGVSTRSFPADINPPITAASLRDGLAAALVSAGFPAILKSYAVSTDQYAVWQLVFDSSKTYGTVYYRLKVTSALVVSHALGTSWTDATNTLNQPTAEFEAITYVSNIAVKSWGFKSEELCLVSAVQGSSVSQLLGYFRFADAPAFDENSFPKIFIPNANDAGSVCCSLLTPYASNVFTSSLLNPAMANADPYLQQRSQATGIFLFGPSSTGIMARSTDDLSMGSCNGMVRGDVFQIPNTNPVQQYLLLKPASGALLVRIQ